MTNSIDAPDWSQLPVPIDDGAVDHLFGLVLPCCPLPATAGADVDLAALRGRTVVYAYPRTGRPGVDNCLKDRH